MWDFLHVTLGLLSFFCISERKDAPYFVKGRAGVPIRLKFTFDARSSRA